PVVAVKIKTKRKKDKDKSKDDKRAKKRAGAAAAAVGAVGGASSGASREGVAGGADGKSEGSAATGRGKGAAAAAATGDDEEGGKEDGGEGLSSLLGAYQSDSSDGDGDAEIRGGGPRGNQPHSRRFGESKSHGQRRSDTAGAAWRQRSRKTGRALLAPYPSIRPRARLPPPRARPGARRGAPLLPLRPMSRHRRSRSPQPLLLSPPRHQQHLSRRAQQARGLLLLRRPRRFLVTMSIRP
ncbi:unnamed protein product, partial [Ectocarpus sp. 8 AP-2014]